MNTIQVEIISEGMAKEVNLIKKPSLMKALKDGCPRLYYRDFDKWELAESQRRVFKIVNIGEMIDGKIELFFSGLGGTEKIKLAEIGSIHTAEIVNEKEVIIK